MDKQPTENKVDAARGVPQEQDSSDDKLVSSGETNETERLDDRIRKAGI